MTTISAQLKWRLPLAIAAVLGGTLTFAGASLGSEAAPVVRAASVSACSSVSLEASAGAGSGSSVSLTAAAVCDGTPIYAFFERSASTSPWALIQGWGGPTFTTPANAGGLSEFLAWATDGSPTVPQVQAEQDVTPASSQQAACTATSISPNPTAVTPYQSLAFTATAQCPAGAEVEYSYFVGPSGSGPWTLMAAWIGPAWTWNPSATAAGINYAIVWVSDGPYTLPQAQTTVALQLPAPVGCSAVTASTVPNGSATAGSAVSVDASSTCTSSSAAEYSYFSGGSSSGPWTLQAAWIGPTWTWNTAGDPPGTYYVLVWASDGPYTVPQVQFAVPLTLTGSTPVPPGGTALANPSINLAPSFAGTCWEDGYESLGCQETEAADIDSALASEGLQPLTWPAALYNLPLAEQEFVVTNEERVLRGLAPITGMATAADQNALAGAQAEEDPPIQEVPGENAALGNWAEDYGALGSDFDWMYNDGPGSFNIDCPSGSSSSGCWGHRDAILTNTISGPLAAPNGYTWVAGDACIPDSSISYFSNCDLEYVLVPTTGVGYDFTWAQALADGA
jgi:hypothetical protein